MSSDVAYFEQSELWTHEVDDARLLDRARNLDSLLPEDIGSLLDVGTGNGKVLHPLAEARGPAVTIVGLDRSWEALRGVTMPRLQASADALPVADRSFDVVMTCELLEHLPEPVFRDTLAELARTARRSVVITVPNRENLKLTQVDCTACGCRYSRRRHLRQFQPEHMGDLVPGFELVRTVEFGHSTRRYPRRLRQTLERRGVVPVHDAPTCPQCGEPHGARRSGGAGETPNVATDVRRYNRLRTKLPSSSRPYWLGARFDRR